VTLDGPPATPVDGINAVPTLSGAARGRWGAREGREHPEQQQERGVTTQVLTTEGHGPRARSQSSGPGCNGPCKPCSD